jgi:hypothetical protein
MLPDGTMMQTKYSIRDDDNKSCLLLLLFLDTAAPVDY